MIGALFGTVIGGLKRLFTGFVVLLVVVYVVAKYTDVGMTGRQAVMETAGNFRDMASLIVGECVGLGVDLWDAVTGALKQK